MLEALLGGKPRRAFSLGPFLATGFVATACGNPSAAPTAPVAFDAGDARTPATSDRFLPLAVGAQWAYHTVDPTSGASGETQSVVEAFEDVGGAKAGTQAYRVRSTTLTEITVNWQQDLGTSVVRQREDFFDLAGVPISSYVFTPYRLRLDESPAHTVAGATWTESNTAAVDNISAGSKAIATFSVSWTVEAVDDMVTVPAGTFSCLRVRRVESGYASSNEVQWFARHVGKVKESGATTEELTSYSVP